MLTRHVRELLFPEDRARRASTAQPAFDTQLELRRAFLSILHERYPGRRWSIERADRGTPVLMAWEIARSRASRKHRESVLYRPTAASHEHRVERRSQ